MNATTMGWEDVARKDAIEMLRQAIKEMEEHPERFLEYSLSIDSIETYPRLRRLSIAFEIPEDPIEEKS